MIHIELYKNINKSIIKFSKTVNAFCCLIFTTLKLVYSKIFSINNQIIIQEKVFSEVSSFRNCFNFLDSKFFQIQTFSGMERKSFWRKIVVSGTLEVFSLILNVFLFFHVFLILFQTSYEFLQKQSFRGVLRKTCSENMQQIYNKTYF